MSDKIERRGDCFILAWGPPWNWLPSFQRSCYHDGWSVTWLWCGVYRIHASAATLLLEGAYRPFKKAAPSNEEDDTHNAAPRRFARGG